MGWRQDLKTAIKQVFDDHIPNTRAYDYSPEEEPDTEQIAIVELADEEVAQSNIGKAIRKVTVVVHLLWFMNDPSDTSDDFETFVDDTITQFIDHRAKPGQLALHGVALDFARHIRVLYDPVTLEGQMLHLSAHVEVDASLEVSLT